MKATKSNQVRALLASNDGYTAKDIAELVECDVTLVYQLKREMAKPKRGRPRKVTTVINATSVVSLIDATKTIHDTVKEIKDFGISFDYAREDYDIIWRDEVYQVAPSELQQTLDCIKFLASKELGNVEIHHDDF